MKVTVVSRSGREIVKGGLEINDSVSTLSFSLDFVITFVCLVAMGVVEKK